VNTCHACGHTVSPTARFCGKCGASLQSESSASALHRLCETLEAVLPDPALIDALRTLEAPLTGAPSFAMIGERGRGQAEVAAALALGACRT
jgi:hypothetical protein